MPEIKLYFFCTNGITVYSIDTSGRFIQKDIHGNEIIILEAVTPVFDGLTDTDGVSHFAVQGADGSLMYLKSDENEWKKYVLFTSKNKSATITNIILKESNGRLCAFYCMNHGNKRLLVRHVFWADNPYATPHVEDVLDSRTEFHICPSSAGFTMFYRGTGGKIYEKTYNKNFDRISASQLTTNEEILHMRTFYNNHSIYCAYTAPRKSYTAVMFRILHSSDEPKVITFGVAKNCIPYIIAFSNIICVQWSENGRIMQSVSRDGGKTFSPPGVLDTSYEFVRLKFSGRILPFDACICAAQNNIVSIQHIIKKAESDFITRKENSKMSLINSYRDYDDSIFFIKKLSEIESDISRIGDELKNICGFLEKLTDFKAQTNEDTYTRPIKSLTASRKASLSGTDIGSKDETNIRLFESIDIDSDTMPEIFEAEADK